MRKVNQRSRLLRHYNTGAQSTSYFSQVKSFFSQLISPQKNRDFSVIHTQNSYDDQSQIFSASNSRLKQPISLNNLKKYLTHAGIVAVAGFTILTNSCFGPTCNKTLNPGSYALANSNQSDLIEINLEDGQAKNNLVTQKDIAQIASTVANYTASDEKKNQINQAIQAQADDKKSDLALIQNSYLEKTNTPVTEVSDTPRKNIIIHLVKSDETLWSIADKYKISTDTIKWSNGMDDSGTLLEGQEIYIMPMNGIYYTVQDGDSLSSISEKYESNLDDILAWNNLDGDLSIGQKLILPGGTVPPPPAPVVTTPSYSDSSSNSDNSYYQSQSDPGATPLVGSGQFGWPTSGMFISQYFGATSFNPWHTGLDLDSRSGWDIFASDSGTISTASYGWGGGYGNHIIIDHGNGYQTLYGHLSALDVSVGEYVSQGQRIGTMGSTGWSTGPHLHFEIRYNGSFLNPLNYL